MGRKSRWTAAAATVLGAVLSPGVSYAEGQGAIVEPVDNFVIYGAVNPCTGATVDVAHTAVTGTFRSGSTATGQVYHQLEMLRGTATTSDGYSGHYAERFIVTDLDPGSFDDFTATNQITYAVRGPGHETAVYHFRYHVRVIAGEVVVFADVLDERCVGKP